MTPATDAGSAAETAEKSRGAVKRSGAASASDRSATPHVTGTDPRTSPAGPSSRSHDPAASPARAVAGTCHSTHTSTGERPSPTPRRSTVPSGRTVSGSSTRGTDRTDPASPLWRT